MPQSLLFGDVFLYEGLEYVYLAQTDTIIYLARILSKDDTARIDKVYQSKIAKGTITKVERIDLYCYVILETKEFKDRCAHLHNPGKDVLRSVVQKLSAVLDREDLLHIKEEISTQRAIPLELKDLVKDIQI